MHRRGGLQSLLHGYSKHFAEISLDEANFQSARVSLALSEWHGLQLHRDPQRLKCGKYMHKNTHAGHGAQEYARGPKALPTKPSFWPT